MDGEKEKISLNHFIINKLVLGKNVRLMTSHLVYKTEWTVWSPRLLGRQKNQACVKKQSYQQRGDSKTLEIPK